VHTLDQLIELLFERDAGNADSDGRYPPSTVNGMVQLQLSDWAEQARKLAAKGDD